MNEQPTEKQTDAGGHGMTSEEARNAGKGKQESVDYLVDQGREASGPAGEAARKQSQIPENEKAHLPGVHPHHERQNAAGSISDQNVDDDDVSKRLGVKE